MDQNIEDSDDESAADFAETMDEHVCYRNVIYQPYMTSFEPRTPPLLPRVLHLESFRSHGSRRDPGVFACS